MIYDVNRRPTFKQTRLVKKKKIHLAGLNISWSVMLCSCTSFCYIATTHIEAITIITASSLVCRCVNTAQIIYMQYAGLFPLNSACVWWHAAIWQGNTGRMRFFFSQWQFKFQPSVHMQLLSSLPSPTTYIQPKKIYNRKRSEGKRTVSWNRCLDHIERANRMCR